jgi:hypothetical protein
LAANGSRRHAVNGDVVDAQLSALLESVEADGAHVRVVTQRSATVATAPARRPRRKLAPKHGRALGARRTAGTPTRVAGFAPNAQPARIPFLSDPAVREAAYYAVAAVILATGLGLLCARLLT